jgi:hypothetical protein
LIEETRDLYDDSAFLVGAFGEAPAKESLANVEWTPFLRQPVNLENH